MDAGERALLESTVRDAIGRATTDGLGGVALDGVLGDLGWLDLLDAAPRDAVEIVFGALGSVGAVASALDDVVAAAAGLVPRPDLAVLLPPFARWEPPGTAVSGGLEAAGMLTLRAVTAAEVLVVVTGRTDDTSGVGATTCGLVVVPIHDVAVSPVHGIDPDGGLHRAVVRTDAAALVPVAPDRWEAAVAAGQRAVARQLAGALRTMLSLARTHALDREQFGRPVAQFQAVRHRLADALVAVEALEASLDAAWDDGGPVTAALAKAAAGRAARIVSTQCQQVLAGIGFTTEHPFHRFLKRTMVLEGLLGSGDELVVALGRHLVATRTVPTLLEL